MPAKVTNIWVAAGDGDLSRVQELVETTSVSPNAADQFSYTPMHAAASYGHLDVLRYLLSHGGDINITDDDGDTPLYTVEDSSTARFLVEHGATLDHRNNDGLSPVEHLSKDFPGVAAFLSSILPDVSPPARMPPPHPCEYDQHVASEQLTSQLLASVHDVMQNAEVEGKEPDDDLRQVVTRAVLDGVTIGHQMSADSESHNPQISGVNGTSVKRSKPNDAA